MMGVGVTSLLLILGIFCSASWADQSMSAVRECLRGAEECLAPVQAAYAGMSRTQILNRINFTDLSETCGPVMAARDCVQNIMTECQVFDSEDPRLRDTVRMFRIADRAINYVCVDHIDVFNENKGCLLFMRGGPYPVPQIIMDVEAQCQPPISAGPTRPLCIPASTPECVAGFVEQQCGAEVANALRGLGQQIVADIGTCEGRRLFKLMKKKEMKNKEMKKKQMKKEMFSPLELMHKAFPSLF